MGISPAISNQSMITLRSYLAHILKFLIFNVWSFWSYWPYQKKRYNKNRYGFRCGSLPLFVLTHFMHVQSDVTNAAAMTMLDYQWLNKYFVMATRFDQIHFDMTKGVFFEKRAYFDGKMDAHYKN